MNKTTAFLLIVITALSFFLGSTLPSKAQTKNFIGVIPFISNTGRIGFFDQNTGKLYVYDTDFNKCVFTGQIQSLGQAIQTFTK